MATHATGPKDDPNKGNREGLEKSKIARKLGYLDLSRYFSHNLDKTEYATLKQVSGWERKKEEVEKIFASQKDIATSPETVTTSVWNPATSPTTLFFDLNDWTPHRPDKRKKRKAHGASVIHDHEGREFKSIVAVENAKGLSVLTHKHGKRNDALVVDKSNKVYSVYEIKSDSGRNSVDHAVGQLEHAVYDMKKVISPEWKIELFFVAPTQPSWDSIEFLSSRPIPIKVFQGAQ